jgi:hypothetical protein
MDLSSVVFDNVGLIAQDKANGSASRDDTKRFVRCIEYERAPHDYLLETREKIDDRTLMNLIGSIDDTTPSNRLRRVDREKQIRDRHRIE